MSRFGVYFLAVVLSLSVGLSAKAAEGQTLEAVKVGAGSVSLNALLQVWAVNQTSTPHENFRLRRAELGFAGTVGEQTRWFLKVDVAKTLRNGPVTATNDNKILQDLGVGFTIFPASSWFSANSKAPRLTKAPPLRRISLSPSARSPAALLATSVRSGSWRLIQSAS